MGDRRSLWAWGLESEEPTEEDRQKVAASLSKRAGQPITPRPLPRVDDVVLRPPRIAVPSALAACCTTETWERAFHAYGSHLTDRTHAFNLEYPNPPDVVAHPADEAQLEATLDWCGQQRLRRRALRRRLVGGVGREPAGGRRRRHGRPRPARPRPRDRRDVTGRPHPGRRARALRSRTSCGRPATPCATSRSRSASPRSAAGSRPVRAATTPPTTPTSTTSSSRCACSRRRAGGSRGGCPARGPAPHPTGW